MMSRFDELLTKEFLQQHYVDKQLNTGQVGRLVGCSDMTVSAHLRKHGFELRKPGLSPLDLTNRKFGMLVAIENLGRKSPRSRAHLWRCKCECGNEKIVDTQALRSGNTSSCGCFRARKGVGRTNWRGGKFLSGSFWSSLTCGAGNRSLEIGVTPEEVEQLLFDCDFKCVLSGMNLIDDDGKFVGSLDRIDNMLGYVAGNIQWLHKDVNKMKWAFSQDYFITMCNRIAAMNIGNVDETRKLQLRQYRMTGELTQPPITQGV